MKTLFTWILCLYCISAFSQTSQVNSTDGTYTFQKAIFTTYNESTKAEVDTRVIADPALLDTTDVFFQRVFLEASISNGVLSSCILANQREYLVQDESMLIPAKKSDEKSDSGNNNIQLLPYSTSFSNDILTFTFLELYGDSRYSFPLEGKLTITLSKQKYK